MTEEKGSWRSAGLVLGGAAAAAIGLAGYAQLAGWQAEREVPADGKLYHFGGARLHVVERGDPDAPAIVMIHGLGGQLRNFSYSLAERLEGRFRLILVDRPGSGYSLGASGGEPGLAGQAALVAKLIGRLGLERPLVVGHSLGGTVALALALNHPDKVGGLALIAPLTQMQEEVPPVFRLLTVMPRGARRLLAQLVGTPLSRLAGKRARDQVFAPEPAPDDFDTRGGGVLAARPAALASAAADLAAVRGELPALAARYGEISVPTGILYARRDALLDAYAQGEVTARAIPEATYELIDGGHMIPLTRPDETAAFIEGVAARMG